ncbi:MAG: hypothetical protein ACREPZ_03005, partial [Rhodanobacteraceae bacterium]
ELPGTGVRQFTMPFSTDLLRTCCEAAVVESQAMDGRSGASRTQTPPLATSWIDEAIKDDRT